VTTDLCGMNLGKHFVICDFKYKMRAATDTLTPIFHQSVLVRASIQDVVQEAVTAAFLTAMMVLLFLGSWRAH
jgi:multidrug efflux pump subunit AcrB